MDVLPLGYLGVARQCRYGYFSSDVQASEDLVWYLGQTVS